MDAQTVSKLEEVLGLVSEAMERIEEIEPDSDEVEAERELSLAATRLESASDHIVAILHSEMKKPK